MWIFRLQIREIVSIDVPIDFEFFLLVFDLFRRLVDNFVRVLRYVELRSPLTVELQLAIPVPGLCQCKLAFDSLGVIAVVEVRQNVHLLVS